MFLLLLSYWRIFYFHVVSIHHTNLYPQLGVETFMNLYTVLSYIPYSSLKIPNFFLFKVWEYCSWVTPAAVCLLYPRQSFLFVVGSSNKIVQMINFCSVVPRASCQRRTGHRLPHVEYFRETFTAHHIALYSKPRHTDLISGANFLRSCFSSFFFRLSSTLIWPRPFATSIFHLTLYQASHTFQFFIHIFTSTFVILARFSRSSVTLAFAFRSTHINVGKPWL